MMALNRVNARRWSRERHPAMPGADLVVTLVHDERGSALVMVAVSLVALLGASMLAIDVGQLMTARSHPPRALSPPGLPNSERSSTSGRKTTVFAPLR